MQEGRPSGLCWDCEQLEALPDKLSARKQLGGIPFRDMKHLDEVDRILEIVKILKENPGMVLLVMVDCGPDHVGKGDRWITEIKKLLPQVTVVSRSTNVPISDVESIKLRL